MITTIIVSKDRPAQLDLLLRSIERNGGGWFTSRYVSPVIVIGGGGPYSEIAGITDHCLLPEWNNSFEGLVRLALDRAEEFMCFMTDDAILYRPLPCSPLLAGTPPMRDEILCFSLHLGRNTTRCYPLDTPQEIPPGFPFWEWHKPEPSDFHYPGSIDGHIFRTADILELLDGAEFPNPTALECVLANACAAGHMDHRPLMASFEESVYVGNPINRVSEQSGVRYGATFPVTAEECNRRFLAGERIALDELDFSGVNGAHTEIELVWR